MKTMPLKRKGSANDDFENSLSPDVRKLTEYGFDSKGKTDDELLLEALQIKNNDELIDVKDTDWFKKMQDQLTPGKTLRFYRKRDGLTQSQLAKKLGTQSQNVSGMENDSRAISVDMARQLSAIFGTSYKSFL